MRSNSFACFLPLNVQNRNLLTSAYVHVYHGIVAVETVCNLAAVLLMMAILPRVMFFRFVHINLWIVVCAVAVIFNCMLYARLLLTLHELEILFTGASWTYVITVLIGFRYAGLIASLLFAVLVVVERACATLLVEDYERKQRLYISVILITANVAFSAEITFLVMDCQLEATIYCACLLLPIGVGVVGFHLLLRKNVRRLEHLRLASFSGYTLSLKTQLNENIWTMRLVRQGAIAAFIVVFCGVPVLAPAIYIFHYVIRDYALYELTLAIVNCFIIWFYSATFLFIAFRTKQLRDRIIALFLCNGTRRITPTTSHEGDNNKKIAADIYFSQLSHSWS